MNREEIADKFVEEMAKAISLRANTRMREIHPEIPKENRRNDFSYSPWSRQRDIIIEEDCEKLADILVTMLYRK